MNVLDKLPLKERATWVPRVRAIWQADSEKAARQLATGAARELREAGYDRAASCLTDDLDRCLRFYQFPEAHWIHLRTTNPIESIFATVRLRTNAAKRFKKTKSGVYLMHQVITRLSKGWRKLRSAELCTQVPLPAKPAKKKSKVA
jgi:transposase-like protein